jgi:signal transduction histidine kinase
VTIRAKLTIVAIIGVAIGILFATVVWQSFGLLDAASAAQRQYAGFRRDVTGLRDVIFEYVADRDTADAARVADTAAYVRGAITERSRLAEDPQERAQLDRVSASLQGISNAARRLSLGVSDPLGAAGRAELERGLYAEATDASAGVELLQQRAEDSAARVLAGLRTMAVLMLIIGMGVGFGSILSIGLRVRRGLSDLTEGLKAFAAGDLDARIEPKGHDELTVAAEGFNHMAGLVREHDRELSQLNDRLIAADRLKSEFVANMSHDLRTPLNSIIGFSGVLMTGMAGHLTEEQKRQVRFINRSGEHLKSLVDDVLDISRLDSVGWESRPRRFELEPLVQDVVDTIHSSAAAKSIKVTSAVSPKGAHVVADELGVRRILMNLAGNAAKFTTHGSIDIEVTVKRNELRLVVSDTGPGIAEQDRARIFEPFEQARTSVPGVAKPEGSGLGLSIVRRIATGLGGTMELESDLGKGSRFSVTLPLRATRDLQAESPGTF